MRKRILRSAVFFCCAGMSLWATTSAPAQNRFAVAPVANGAQQVTLDRSALALMGPWRFRLGDNTAWAQPGFDDSGWQEYTLKAQGWSDSVLNAGEGSDPGWAGHGHRGVWGFGWYRIRVHLEQAPDPLNLLVRNVDSAYTVYWDGQKLGGFGDPDRHVTYATRGAQSFSIPLSLSGSGDHALAFRVWDRPLRAVENSPTSGGLLDAPLLADRGTAARLLLLSRRTETVGQLTAGMTELLPFFLVGVFSLLLYSYSRKQQEYLWIGLALLSFILSDTFIFLLPSLNDRLATNNAYPISDVVTQLYVLFSLLATQWLLGLQNRRAMRVAIWITGCVYFLAYASLTFNGYVLLSPWLDKFLEYAALTLIPCFVVFLWMVVAGIRTQGRLVWLMLSPWIILTGQYAWTIFTRHRISRTVFLTGYAILDLLLPLSVLAILAYRFLRQWREHRRIEGELQQAQAVQTLLVPEHLPRTPGYRVAGTYLPASQVGGDFYQVLPLPNGGLIAVLGDVSGKGLRAAMVVSMAVGALRAIVKETGDPAEILSRLNRELTGNLKSGFVTCVCARMDPDGIVTVANAGHLPPWVNGKEVAMDGALPLGMLAGAEYEAQNFHLAAGDTLILMSDGIVEARSEKDGELYGFDRLAALLAARPTANEIAKVAQRFGQEDDISVLEISRVAVAEPAIA